MLGKFKCRKIRSLFADYIDGSLERKPKLLASFNEHIATCDECKNALKGYRAVLTALSAVASEGVHIPDGVCEETYRAVLRRIELMRTQRKFKLPVLLKPLLGFCALAITALLGVFYLNTARYERHMPIRSEEELAVPSAHIGTESMPPLSGSATPTLPSERQQPNLRRAMPTQRAKVKAYAKPQMPSRQKPEGGTEVELAPSVRPSIPEKMLAGEVAKDLSDRHLMSVRRGYGDITSLPEPILVEPQRAQVGSVEGGEENVVGERVSGVRVLGYQREMSISPAGVLRRELSKERESKGVSEEVEKPKPARPEPVSEEVKVAAEAKLRAPQLRHRTILQYAPSEAPSHQTPVELEVVRASPAVFNQRSLWTIALKPKQNLENVRVLAYAPKFIDAEAVNVLLRQSRAPAEGVAQEGISRQEEARSVAPAVQPKVDYSYTPIWEGSLNANTIQLIPVPINPLALGAQEVRLVVESLNKPIVSWIALYPVAKAFGQFGGAVEKSRVSVKAEKWRFIDLCRYLANRVGSVIIFPADLANAELPSTLNFSNITYGQLVRTIADTLNLQVRISDNVTIFYSREGNASGEASQGR